MALISAHFRPNFVPYDRSHRIDLLALVEKATEESKIGPGIAAIKLNNLLKEKITTVFNKSRTYSKEFILQDLLFLGEETGSSWLTKEQLKLEEDLALFMAKA